MKRLVMVLGVLAILAAGVTFGLAQTVHAKGGGKNMVVDVVITFFTPNTLEKACALDRGERAYNQGDVYAEGQFGLADPIGVFHSQSVSTELPGTCGFFVTRVFRIFERGDIFGSFLAEPGFFDERVGTTGAITGGTGDFRKISGGEMVVTFDPSVTARFTLKFNKKPKK